MMPDGSFVAAWFAGTREMHPDTAIWMCHQDGDRWSQPRVVAKVAARNNDRFYYSPAEMQAHWNPVLHLCHDGRLALYFKVGRFPDSWDTWKMMVDRNGMAFSHPRILKSTTLDCGKATMGPVRNKIVALSDGTLIAPSSIERTVSRMTLPFKVEWNSIFHVSKNGGKTWRTTKVVGYDRGRYGRFGGIIQPAVWESSKGVASALFRSTTGYLFRSDSTDGGITWADAFQTDMPNPNSAVDVAVRNGILAMIHNPVTGNWARRSPLSLSFSNLEGVSFGGTVNIEDGIGSYSYPAMIATDYGFAMTYTFSRRRIAFVEARIVEQEMENGRPNVKVELFSSIKPYDWPSGSVPDPGDQADGYVEDA